jgi:pimeloyl-ACP methyl ester carboxylesterase
MRSANFILPDGQTLAFAEYGDSSGHPVLFFHGFPGSRLQAGDFNDDACKKQCRLIGIDRPGMGASTPHKNHTLLSWVDDIKHLLNELNIDKVSIVAHSGGAPFALSCAHLLPDRIRNIALVSPLAPTTSQKAKEGMMMGYKVINALVRNVPGFSYFLMMLQKNLILRPNVFKKVIKKMPNQDQVIFGDERFQTQALDALREAFKQGVKGAAYEFQLILKKWPFKLDEINTLISIWHGKKDMQVPRSFINILSSGLPNSTIHSLPEEAHLSTLYNHMEEILETIKSD